MGEDIDLAKLQIGEFAELVATRSTDSGYRYYSPGQTGAARVIALLRSMDMPIAEIRRIVSGASDAERKQIFRNHRARLEARLDEVRQLLEAVDALTEETR
jgi:DNA-binding transcriptional MerR regulator